MPRRRKYELKGAIDTGSPMLPRHFTVIPRFSDPQTMVMSIADGTEIDRLLLHDVITVLEHSTLQTFAKKVMDSGIDDLRSPNFEGVGSNDPTITADKRAHKIRSIVALIKRMDRHHAIGSYRRKKLINLVTASAPWGDPVDLHPVIRAMDEIFTRR